MAYLKCQVVLRPMVALAVGFVCLVSGCGRGDTDEIGALRDEVAELKQEVSDVKARLRNVQRAERRAAAREAERVSAVSGDNRRREFAERAASNGVRRVREVPSRPTPEELKARHEAMRDPAKREQLWAEHKARMEERRVRMEEHRQRMEERRQRHQKDDADSQTAISE